MSTIALTRPVSPSIGDCELSHLARAPIDPDRAAAQHRAYEAALHRLGCRILPIPAAPDHPDAVFVEDTAVVVDELAIITRPGAPSRRGEVDAVAAAASALRPVARVEPPGTVDGGDVLRVGRTLFVGASARTNPDGIRQLRGLLGPLGYEVRAVAVDGCLHLKTAVTAVASDTVLLNPSWVDPAEFREYRVLEVDPAEPHAANVLRVGDTILMPEAHPATRRRLQEAGLQVETVDVSELAKAEAGVTCCSILLEENPRTDEVDS